jgi:hypothetical protein
MKLRVGYELQYAFPQPTPAILMLNVHFTRVSDLAAPDHIRPHFEAFKLVRPEGRGHRSDTLMSLLTQKRTRD